MQNDAITKASKKMSWLLRHGAVEAGVGIDSAGWVAIDEVLRALQLTRSELDDAVRLNNKSRFQVEGDRIRAAQGHSMGGVALSLDDLEASWEVFTSELSVWHGTFASLLPSIAAEGLLPGARTHVHLAATADSPVGKRGSVDVLLEISPARIRAAGLTIFHSPNGVVLVRCVPSECIVGVAPLSTRTTARIAELRALFTPERQGAPERPT
jgi:putative RNA 2'-phosphotransferase